MGYSREDQLKEWEAVTLAMNKHSGQEYRPGLTYMYHIDRVHSKLKWLPAGHPARIVAVLHDICEDTDVTWSYLQEHFGVTVANCVGTLTRRGLSYPRYIRQIKARGGIALLVKIADVHANLEALDHPDCPPEKKHLRERYLKALEVLEADNESQNDG